MRQQNSILLIALMAGLSGVVVAHASPLQGIYSSPVGDLRVFEEGGVVRGKFAGGANPCGLKPGALVLEGTRLDDSVTGTLRVCRVGDGCSGGLEGLVMLLVSNRGAVMSGAVHFQDKQCQSPLSGDALRLKRSGAKSLADPGRASGDAPAAPPTPSVAAAPVAPPRGGAAAAPLPKLPPPRPPARTGRAQAEALATEAQTLIAAGEIEDARVKLLAAVEADPSYSEAHVGVGVTYYLRDRYDDALEAYKRGLEANPGNRDAYYNIGCVYALKNEPEQALRYLQIAVLNGYVDLKTLDEDPDLRSLVDNPAFQALRAGQL